MRARICSFVSVISPSHLCARHQSPPSAFYFYCRQPDFGTSPPMLRSFLDHAGYESSPDIRADLLTARAARKSAALVLSGQAQRSFKASGETLTASLGKALASAGRLVLFTEKIDRDPLRHVGSKLQGIPIRQTHASVRLGLADLSRLQQYAPSRSRPPEPRPRIA